MINEETLTFRNGRGDTLSGVLHHPEHNPARGAVILCHGMESDKNSEKLVFLGGANKVDGVRATIEKSLDKAIQRGKLEEPVKAEVLGRLTGSTSLDDLADVDIVVEAIAEDLEARHGKAVDPASVVVSAGAKQALFNTLFVLAGPGDKVLVPVPYWTSYPEMVALARAEPVAVQGPEARDFRIGVEELERAWSPDARVLLLNSPSNPSGAVYGRDEIEAILAWAVDRGVRVISDEIYIRLCYTDAPAAGIHAFSDRLTERAVLIDGASKTFAMTGWRIGWSVSEPKLAATLGALQSHTTSNAATPSQYAALAALTATGDQMVELDAMAAEFRARRAAGGLPAPPSPCGR